MKVDFTHTELSLVRQALLDAATHAYDRRVAALHGRSSNLSAHHNGHCEDMADYYRKRESTFMALWSALEAK